jgi:hypothetical protein
MKNFKKGVRFLIIFCLPKIEVSLALICKKALFAGAFRLYIIFVFLCLKLILED